MRPNTQPFVAHDKAQQSSRLKRLLPSGLGDAFSPESGAGVRVLGERDSPLGTILDSKAEPQLFLRTADPLHTLAHQPSKAHEASRPLFF